jgi:hypothetical protein
MNEHLASVLRQRGKNLTLLIVIGGIVAVVHKEAAVAVMTAVCLAVGAPAVADNWAAKAAAKEGEA